MKSDVMKYLSKIGSHGGRKSKRHLDSQTAKQMVRIREARKAFNKYYSQCFWSYDPNLHIDQTNVQWVGEQLLKQGGMSLWELGNKLCQ